MDGRKFDELARKLAKSGSRRSLFKGLIGGGAAVVAAKVAAPAEAAATISICHLTRSPNNPYEIITVDPESAEAKRHLRHGDAIRGETNGCCVDSDCTSAGACGVGDCVVNPNTNIATCSYAAAQSKCTAVCDECTGTSATGFNCTPISAASRTECRTAGPNATCDPAEFCDGTSVTCPANAYAGTGTDCGLCKVCDGAGACGNVADGADPNNDCGLCQQCDGSGACERVPDGTDPFNDCAGTDICCSGACQAGPNCGCDTNADCASLTNDATCQVGVCDDSGVNATCGTDPAPAGTVCRASTHSICDPREVCNGTDESCPADAFATAGTDCGLCKVCDSAGGCVNVAAGLDPHNDCGACEECDGAGACRDVTDGTDPFNDCPAACSTCIAGACAADCRDGTAETCCTQTGDCGDPVCNTDGTCSYVADQTECPNACDECTAATVGFNCTAIADDPQTECRASTDPICDPAEYCDGESFFCPADAFATAGTDCGLCKVCDSAGGCVNVAAGLDPHNDCGACEECDGAGACRDVTDGTDPFNDCPAACSTCIAGACTADCRDGGAETCCTATGTCGDPVCSAAGVCSYVADQTECTELCDECTGTSATGFNCTPIPATPPTQCRAAGANATCDPAEYCTGSSATCPTNGYAPAGTSCGSCLSCDGSGNCNSTGTTCGSTCCPTTLPRCNFGICCPATTSTSCSSVPDGCPCAVGAFAGVCGNGTCLYSCQAASGAITSCSPNPIDAAADCCRPVGGTFACKDGDGNCQCDDNGDCAHFVSPSGAKQCCQDQGSASQRHQCTSNYNFCSVDPVSSTGQTSFAVQEDAAEECIPRDVCNEDECGTVDAGCGATIECGECPCVPLSCADLGVVCGPAVDNCNNAIDCGACPEEVVTTPAPEVTCASLGDRCGGDGECCEGLCRDSDCGTDRRTRCRNDCPA